MQPDPGCMILRGRSGIMPGVASRTLSHRACERLACDAAAISDC